MKDQAINWGPICLAPDVELLAGPNDLPLLYVGGRKSYVRLSAGGAELIRLLDGRGSVMPEELSQMLARQYQIGEEEIRQHLIGFLRQLDEAGALAHDEESNARPQQESWFVRSARRIIKKPRLNLFSWQFDRSLAAGPLALLKAHAGTVVGKAVALAALLALAAVIYAAAGARVMIEPARASLGFIIGGIVLHAAGHELAHALVGSYYGVKIREFGVALLYYFIPVAYTDRTDAYRLRDFKSRAAISVAGPTFDLYGAGMSAAASCLTSGAAAMNFRLLMWLQIVAFISNLNPLLPSDGYHVLEALFGGLNFRRRAFSLLFRRLTFRGVPPHLQGLDADQQLGHIAYAVAALGYTLLLAAVFTYNLSHVAARAFGR